MNLLIDGVPTDRVAVTDRGLHYGDGLFETVAVTEGVPELWQRHLHRLCLGCERLAIPMPDADLLRAEAGRVCAGTRRAVLKLILTRGHGGRGYRPPQEARPTRILALYPWPDYPAAWWQEGVEVRVCRHRLSLNPILAGIKHLNRLDQVLARGEWSDPEISEGLLLDPLGQVIEGTMSNLFLVRTGHLITPALTQAGIAGVMRGLIMDAAATLGISCHSSPLTLTDLMDADELFLCNSIIGIWPVRLLESRVYKPVPGAITARLSEAIAEIRQS
jgi:4-amino-4-deoxychorismate lyase